MTDPTLAALTAAIEQLGRSPGYETGPTRTPYLRGYHEALYDVLRVLDAQAGETGWQPIETAPLEGDVLVCYEAQSGRRVVSGEYAGRGRWRIDIGYVQPTHWMPLPREPR